MAYALCRRNALLQLCHYLCAPGLSTRELHWVSYLGVSSRGVYHLPWLTMWYDLVCITYTVGVMALGPVTLWCGSASLPATSARVVHRCVCRGESGCVVYAASRPYPQSLTGDHPTRPLDPIKHGTPLWDELGGLPHELVVVGCSFLMDSLGCSLGPPRLRFSAVLGVSPQIRRPDRE